MLKSSTLRSLFLGAFVAIASFTTVPATAQEETRIEIPATQFEPIGETLVIPQLQIYPVLMIHDKPVSDAPLIYMSIYFRNCSKRYFKTEIISMVVQTSDLTTKIPFDVKHREDDGKFKSPLEGMDESMLNEEGKNMLRTKQTYYIAEPKLGDNQNEIQKLKNAKDVSLLINFKLFENETTVKSMQHSFTLRGKKLNDTIIRYANGESSINQTITAPEIPPSCFEK